MKRCSTLSLLLCVALLMVASGTLLAQDGQGIVRINGGRVIVALNPNPHPNPHSNSQKIKQSTEDPASFVTIYSNLGTGTNVYLPSIGWSVTGPESPGGQVDSATPFTPEHSSNLVLIKVAIEGAGGPNGVTLSLNEDSDGAPGTAIMTWNLANLPAFPSCCELDLAQFEQTVTVEKGVQYWLVATAYEATPSSSLSWNMNSLSTYGTIGQKFGDQAWQITPNSALLPAFSVLGTPVD
jgi:hypothetical protein